MQAQNHGHSVIIHSDTLAGWYFAEVDGNAVYRFGPFESRKVVRELVAVLFPEIPVLEFAATSVLLDDSALMIRCNAERAAKLTKEQEAA